MITQVLSYPNPMITQVLNYPNPMITQVLSYPNPNVETSKRRVGHAKSSHVESVTPNSPAPKTWISFPRQPMRILGLFFAQL